LGRKKLANSKFKLVDEFFPLEYLRTQQTNQLILYKNFANKGEGLLEVTD